MTKVVILAGGRGIRLQEHTGTIPKPLLLVGGIPIIQHIIDNFVRGGFTEFVIPIGYLGGKLQEYFRDKYTLKEEHEGHMVVSDGKITLTIVNTGIDTLTGGRILRLKEYLTEPFMLTYGDGLCNVNPKYVKELGEELGKNIITAVHPPARFGGMAISPTGEVVAFSEKQINPMEWVNGGFMYLKPEVLNYISGDDCNFETYSIPKIVWESGLYSFRYEGIWHCIDTVRDLELANDMMKSGEFKWSI